MFVLQRIANRVSKLGEDFTVGSNTYRGVFKPLDSGTLRTYLNDVEIMGIVNPGLLLITTPGAVINVNDTITRDSRTYTVLRSMVHRIAGVAVVRFVILG
jgi:hypothetical protein